MSLEEPWRFHLILNVIHDCSIDVARLKHTLREGNGGVDCMANWLGMELIVFV